MDPVQELLVLFTSPSPSPDQKKRLLDLCAGTASLAHLREVLVFFNEAPQIWPQKSRWYLSQALFNHRDNLIEDLSNEERQMVYTDLDTPAGNLRTELPNIIIPGSVPFGYDHGAVRRTLDIRSFGMVTPEVWILMGAIVDTPHWAPPGIRRPTEYLRVMYGRVSQPRHNEVWTDRPLAWHSLLDLRDSPPVPESALQMRELRLTGTGEEWGPVQPWAGIEKIALCNLLLLVNRGLDAVAGIEDLLGREDPDFQQLLQKIIRLHMARFIGDGRYLYE